MTDYPYIYRDIVNDCLELRASLIMARLLRVATL